MDKILKSFIVIFVVLFTFQTTVQAQESIWDRLQAQCGKAFAGTLEYPKDEPGFSDQELVMHVLSCNDSVLYIPFFVGEERSRTWIIRKQDIGYSLHHDHRNEDGTPEVQTMYGGHMNNAGNDTMYVFPADNYTCELLDYACGNVWWITMDDQYFTYNLRRVGTDRLFTVRFDLSKSVKTPELPWGWKK